MKKYIGKFILGFLVYAACLYCGYNMFKEGEKVAGLIVAFAIGLASAYLIFSFVASRLADVKKPIVTYRTIPVYNDDRWPFWYSIRYVYAEFWGHKMRCSYDRYQVGDKQRALNEIYATINTKYYDQIQQKSADDTDV